MLSILLSSLLNRFKSDYHLTSQRRSGCFSLAATALGYHKLEKTCKPSLLLYFFISLQLPTTDTSLLTVGKGKKCCGLVYVAKMFCGRPLWLALLLLLMQCTWAAKCVWKEAALAMKTDSLKSAFIQFWSQGIWVNVLKNCYQIFGGLIPQTFITYILSPPCALPWIFKWYRFKIMSVF